MKSWRCGCAAGNRPSSGGSAMGGSCSICGPSCPGRRRPWRRRSGGRSERSPGDRTLLPRAQFVAVDTEIGKQRYVHVAEVKVLVKDAEALDRLDATAS